MTTNTNLSKRSFAISAILTSSALIGTALGADERNPHNAADEALVTRTAALDIASNAAGRSPVIPGAPSGVLQVAMGPDGHQEIVPRARPTSTPAAPHSSPQIAFQFFVGKGLSKVQASGIVGNLMQESTPSMNPRSIEPHGAGRGVAQWGVKGRWDTSPRDNVLWYARTHHTSEWALTTQLNFIWYELTTIPSFGLRSLRAATTVAQATRAFMTHFEACLTGKCEERQRLGYAQRVLRAYGGTVQVGAR
jgi:hypothetical protein